MVAYSISPYGLAPWTALLSFSIFITCLISAHILYNLFFHPLSQVPGHWLYATSRLPYIWQVLNGRLAVKLHLLHEQYGPVVRTASNEVSFINSEAWEIIYGNKNSARREFRKNYDTWNETVNKFTTTLFLANNDDHRRMRKLLSPAFSDQTLQQNESLMVSHIDKFLSCVETASEKFTVPVDFNDWFNWLAFDAVSEFALGESFNTLDDPQHRPWLRGLSQTWHFISIVSSLKSLGRTKDSFAFALPRKLLQRYVDQLSLVGRTALAKLNIVPQHPTFISMARSARRAREPGFKKQAYLSDDEVMSNTELIVTAGTDTSATALPAAIELLARNPEKMSRLLREIRAFNSEDEINSRTVARQAPYLTACIMETLRMYAPVPEGLPRICSGVGQSIGGHWIPGGTFCQVSPHAANRSSYNFSAPDEFLPERWLHPEHPLAMPMYNNDAKGAFRPFSFGPRDCIGQNFALTIMRLTISKLLYRFDVERAVPADWLDQRSYLLWKRRPLTIKLKPSGRAISG